MSAETFKKRQKEVARREKQQKKFARRSERKNEKARAENKSEETNPQAAELASKHGPTIL
jgi:hypothetical protein